MLRPLEMVRFPWDPEAELGGLTQDLGRWRPVAVIQDGRVTFVYVVRPKPWLRWFLEVLRVATPETSAADLSVREGVGVSVPAPAK